MAQAATRNKVISALRAKVHQFSFARFAFASSRDHCDWLSDPGLRRACPRRGCEYFAAGLFLVATALQDVCFCATIVAMSVSERL